MKKSVILSFFLLIFFAFKANSQDFETICQVGSTSWNYISYGACDYFNSDSITILKDSLYNEQTYYVLFNHDFDINDTVGYLREDTILGKLWFREDLHMCQEFLIMDLSLNKNDSFTLYSYFSSFEMIVDTVFYDIESRKHVGFGDRNMQLCAFTPDFEFIEGVGCTACHFYQGISTGEILNTALLCCHKNDELVFSNEEFDNLCTYNITNIQTHDETFISNVFPNPSNGSFIIQFDNSDNQLFNLVIYSLTGQTVFCVKTNQNQIIIDKKLDKGIYLYKLTNQTDMLFSGKIFIAE